MSIPMHLSYWEGKLTLAPSNKADEAYVKLHTLSYWIEGRTIIFYEDKTKGHVASPINRERNAGLGFQYSWDIDEQPWARFMRHEIEFDINGDGYFVGEIPLDHLLPWPRLMRNDTRAPDIAARELFLRALSFWKTGGNLRDFVKNVPDVIRELTRGGAWKDALDAAQKG